MSTATYSRLLLWSACLALTARASFAGDGWGPDAVDAFLADSMNLNVAKGALASDTVLSWSGGPAPYWVHRANSASGVLVPANLITMTSSSSYIDSGSPAPGAVFFFQVVNQWPLTLNRSGPGGITRGGSAACNPSCPETTWHDNASIVTLVATPVNASGYYFSGWSGACSGSSHTCTVTMTQARSVTATFIPIMSNLAFVSSTTFAANQGGATAYDAQCNALATAAGINNFTNNAFIAWLSDANSNAKIRLGGSTRGWIRLDGKPFADTQAGLFTNNVLYHPLRLDESGVDAGNQLVMTGTTETGGTGSHCGNWTGAGSMTYGTAAFGPVGWTNRGTIACSSPQRIYCFMKTGTAALTITPQSGKRIYLSTPVNSGSGVAAFDTRCALDKPAGAGAVKALVATSSTAASSLLIPAQNYVRPDGISVGTGALLAGGGLLSSGIWQDGLGVYQPGPAVRTGAATPSTIGTNASTCSNWNSTVGNVIFGYATTTDPQWWNYPPGDLCSTALRLYCIEQ